MIIVGEDYLKKDEDDIGEGCSEVYSADTKNVTYIFVRVYMGRDDIFRVVTKLEEGIIGVRFVEYVNFREVAKREGLDLVDLINRVVYELHMLIVYQKNKDVAVRYRDLVKTALKLAVANLKKENDGR